MMSPQCLFRLCREDAVDTLFQFSMCNYQCTISFTQSLKNGETLKKKKEEVLDIKKQGVRDPLSQ